MYRFHLRKCSFFFSWSAWVSQGRFARVLSWEQMRKKPGIRCFFSLIWICWDPRAFQFNNFFWFIFHVFFSFCCLLDPLGWLYEALAQTWLSWLCTCWVMGHDMNGGIMNGKVVYIFAGNIISGEKHHQRSHSHTFVCKYLFSQVLEETTFFKVIYIVDSDTTGDR